LYCNRRVSTGTRVTKGNRDRLLHKSRLYQCTRTLLISTTMPHPDSLSDMGTSRTTTPGSSDSRSWRAAFQVCRAWQCVSRRRLGRDQLGHQVPQGLGVLLLQLLVAGKPRRKCRMPRWRIYAHPWGRLRGSQVSRRACLATRWYGRCQGQRRPRICNFCAGRLVPTGVL